MTIDEAIKELQELLMGASCPKEPGYQVATNLGIEALKRVGDYKKAYIAMHYTPMPGETEEN